MATCSGFPSHHVEVIKTVHSMAQEISPRPIENENPPNSMAVFAEMVNMSAIPPVPSVYDPSAYSRMGLYQKAGIYDAVSSGYGIPGGIPGGIPLPSTHNLLPSAYGNLLAPQAAAQEYYAAIQPDAAARAAYYPTAMRYAGGETTDEILDRY